jgi:hypothetical protein
MSSHSTDNPVDDDELWGADDRNGDSRPIEGQDSPTAQRGDPAGNGDVSADRFTPTRRGDGRNGSSMGQEGAVIDDYRDSERSSVAAGDRASNGDRAQMPVAEDRRGQGNGANTAGDEADDELILIDDGDAFRSRWESVQIGFVDDPRRAVQDAQELLSSVVDELIDGFRRNLDESLADNGDRSTDQLRHTFRRYRVLFERLLST